MRRVYIRPLAGIAAIMLILAADGFAQSDAPVKAPKPPSLFFLPAELERIHFALARYEKYKSDKLSYAENKATDFLQQITGSEKETVFVYPQFFLESLVYHSPKDWVVQVNRQRFSPKHTPTKTELKVVSVDKEKISLEWKPKNLERFKAAMTASQNTDTGTDANSLQGTVTFTLRPNQTFSSYVMRVLEGKVEPVTVSSAEPAPASDEPFPPAGTTPGLSLGKNVNPGTKRPENPIIRGNPLGNLLPLKKIHPLIEPQK